jgi:hypothetical protein
MRIRDTIITVLLLLGLGLCADVSINTGGMVHIDNNAQLTVQGSWQNSGGLDAASGSVRFTGSADATITGEQTFYQLSVNLSPDAVMLCNSAIGVTSLLTVLSGALDAGTQSISMGEYGMVLAAPDAISGTLQGVPIAVGTAAYTNAIQGINLTAGTDVGNFYPLLYVSPTGRSEFLSVRNLWDLSSDNPPTGRDLTLSWNSTYDNGVNTSALQMWRSEDDGTTWFEVGAPQASVTNPRTVTAPEIDEFSLWTVGTPLFTTSAQSLDFGACEIGSVQSEQITITNTSLAPLLGTVSISSPYSVVLSGSETTAAERRGRNDKDDGRNSLSISVPVSGAVSLDVTFSPLATGSYAEDLLISFSGSGSPSKEIAVTAVATNTPAITLSPASLDFGYQAVNTTEVQQFTIQNSGTGILSGQIITPSGYSVAVAADEVVASRSRGTRDDGRKTSFTDNTLNFSLEANQSASYNLSFSPTVAQNYAGSLTINHNAAGSPSSITLAGIAEEPNLAISPASIEVTLPGFSVTTRTLTLQNTTHVPVDYTAGVYYATLQPLAQDYGTGSCTSTDKTDVSEVRGHDLEDGWMMFDLSPLPANAQITGVHFHGYVNDTYYPYWNVTPLDVDPRIADAATLHNDICAEGLSGYYLRQVEAATYSSGWKHHLLGGTAAADLQSAIAQGWFAVGICSTDDSPTWYIEFDGWNEANPPYLTVEYALLTDDTPWLTIDDLTTVSGTVPALTTITHTLGINPAGNPDGLYESSILISSDDADQPETYLPVSMTVATPVFVLDPTGLDFGDVVVGESETLQFSISNSGTAQLTGQLTPPDGFSITAAAADIATAKQRKTSLRESRDAVAFSISAGGSQSYDCTFTPTASQDYSSAVTITHNAVGGTDALNLTASGYTLDLSVTPTTINETLYIDGSTTVTVTLTNGGTGTLDWAAETDYGGSAQEWMRLDDGQFTTGQIEPGGSNEILVTLDASGLTAGTWSAIIDGTSTDPENYTFTIAVELLVKQQLPAPQNLSISAADGVVTLSWDAVTGAAQYHVYRAETPDGAYTLESDGTFGFDTRPTWSKTYDPVPQRLFFRVTADDE